MLELLAPLGPEQVMLVRTMAEPYLSSGEWPVWQYVVSKLDSNDLDAEKLIRSLPRVGSRGLAGLSYGAAWPVQYHIAPDSRPGLTVAAASHLPDLVPVMAQPFINVLRVLTLMQLNAPESPRKLKQVTVTPDDIKRALPSISDTFMTRLPVILNTNLRPSAADRGRARTATGRRKSGARSSSTETSGICEGTSSV